VSARAGAPRHQSRRAALQVLYAADVAGRSKSAPAPGVTDVFERVAANFDLHGGAHAFAKELVLGVEAHREEVDARIVQHARNWRLERMAAVDRNVLRLATYELMFTPTPHSVVIDEAVELAREFGSEPSPSFTNGVLDAIARAQRERDEAPPGEDQEEKAP
jgi:N utilization substance protein B